MQDKTTGQPGASDARASVAGGAAREPLQGMRRHKLMPAEIRRELPELYAQEALGADTRFYLKLFCPWSRHTFYVCEFDGEDTLYGFCVSGHGSDCDEWSYGSLREFLTTALRDVPAFERDCHFTSITARELPEWQAWNARGQRNQ